MTTKVSLITTTCDRPFGIPLMERYVAAQTVQPDEWIVADGGNVPAELTMGQVHLHNPQPPGARNLADNVLAGLEAVTGDVVIFIEDDDHYSPRHIERSLAHLRLAPATGSGALNYYNIKHRCWIKMRNRGSALCQTALRASQIPRMADAAQNCRARGDYCIDGKFWSMVRGRVHQDRTVIGIKGLPGTVGLGNGHRPNSSASRRWTDDPEFLKLREWIGDAADNYVNAYNT